MGDEREGTPAEQTTRVEHDTTLVDLKKEQRTASDRFLILLLIPGMPPRYAAATADGSRIEGHDRCGERIRDTFHRDPLRIPSISSEYILFCVYTHKQFLAIVSDPLTQSHY